MHFLKISKPSAFTFFGVFDALCVLAYCLFHLYFDQVPYVHEFQSFLKMLPDAGYLIFPPILMVFSWAFMFWLLNISLVFSCLMFLMSWPAVKYVVGFQRFLFFWYGFIFCVLAYVSDSLMWQLGFATLAVLSFTVLRIRGMSIRGLETAPDAETHQP